MDKNKTKLTYLRSSQMKVIGIDKASSTSTTLNTFSDLFNSLVNGLADGLAEKVVNTLNNTKTDDFIFDFVSAIVNDDTKAKEEVNIIKELINSKDKLKTKIKSVLMNPSNILRIIPLETINKLLIFLEQTFKIKIEDEVDKIISDNVLNTIITTIITAIPTNAIKFITPKSVETIEKYININNSLNNIEIPDKIKSIIISVLNKFFNALKNIKKSQLLIS